MRHFFRLNLTFAIIMDNRFAIIDLGTNTFHLLVANYQTSNDFNILERTVIPVKIGSGGINKQHLTDEAYQRGMDALQNFEKTVKKHNARVIKIIGTSALRNAINAPKFLQDVEALMDCPVALIDGDEEAKYIYQGVRAAIGLWDNPSLILDIGGGSVEFIIGNKQKLYWEKSIEIGAARLLDRFPHEFPINKQDKQNLLEYIKDTLAPLLKNLSHYQLEGLVGASGFFETFTNLHRYRVEKAPSSEMPLVYEFSADVFQSIKQQILSSTREELYNMPGMEPFRVEMMVVSTLLLDVILEETGIKRLYYSDFAVKEGVLAEELSLKQY